MTGGGKKNHTSGSSCSASSTLESLTCLKTSGPPVPSIHAILQVRTQEWVAISFSKRNYRKKESEVTQLSPTVCDPVDYSLPGSSIHGISQARVLEGVAMSFSMRFPYSTLILSIPPLQEPILLSILLFWGLGGGSYYLLMGVFP